MIPVEMTDLDFDDVVHGSGWSSFPWWQQFHLNEGESVRPDAYVVVRAQDPDTDEFVNRSFTKQEVVDALANAAREYPSVARGVIAQDLDADAMDLVFQHLAYGKVVFG